MPWLQDNKLVEKVKRLNQSLFQISLIPDELRAAQEEDATLEKIRGLVGQDVDPDAKVHFIQKKGMMFELFNHLTLRMVKSLLN